MRKVSKEEFVAFIKDMKHVGFASPMPWYGWTDTIEYYEGEEKKAECRHWPNGEEDFFIETPTPKGPNRED